MQFINKLISKDAEKFNKQIVKFLDLNSIS
jgi:hypothetical protein